MRFRFRLVCGLLCGLGLAVRPASVSAQVPGEGLPGQAGTVSGAGIVVIKQPAERMRVEVTVTAKGKDLEEALGRLKSRRAELATQLEGLGAAKDGTDLGPPQMSAGRSFAR